MKDRMCDKRHVRSPSDIVSPSRTLVFLASMGDKCVVLYVVIKGKTISYYRVPRNSSHRAVWREAFGLDEAKLKPFSRVCSIASLC